MASLVPCTCTLLIQPLSPRTPPLPSLTIENLTGFINIHATRSVRTFINNTLHMYTSLAFIHSNASSPPSAPLTALLSTHHDSLPTASASAVRLSPNIKTVECNKLNQLAYLPFIHLREISQENPIYKSCSHMMSPGCYNAISQHAKLQMVFLGGLSDPTAAARPGCRDARARFFCDQSR